MASGRVFKVEPGNEKHEQGSPIENVSMLSEGHKVIREDARLRYKIFDMMSDGN